MGGPIRATIHGVLRIRHGLSPLQRAPSARSRATSVRYTRASRRLADRLGSAQLLDARSWGDRQRVRRDSRVGCTGDGDRVTRTRATRTRATWTCASTWARASALSFSIVFIVLRGGRSRGRGVVTSTQVVCKWHPCGTMFWKFQKNMELPSRQMWKFFGSV